MGMWSGISSPALQESEDVPWLRVAAAYSFFWPVFGINILPGTSPTPFPSHLSRQPVLSRRVDAAGLRSGFAPHPVMPFLSVFGRAWHVARQGDPHPLLRAGWFWGEKKERLGAGVCAGPCGSRTPHVVWGQGLGETPGEPRDLASFGSSLSLAK